MIEVRGRARRYVNRVVILSPRDAFLLSAVLDKQAASKALKGSSEELIDSLRAIDLARDEWATVINQRKPLQSGASKQDSDKWLTPLEIAEALSITHSAVVQALQDGRLIGSKVAGRWRVTQAEFENYNALRTERRTS